MAGKWVKSKRMRSGVDERAGLLDVLAQMPPQHRLEDVGGGVMRGRSGAPGRVHRAVAWSLPLTTPAFHRRPGG